MIEMQLLILSHFETILGDNNISFWFQWSFIHLGPRSAWSKYTKHYKEIAGVLDLILKLFVWMEKIYNLLYQKLLFGAVSCLYD